MSSDSYISFDEGSARKWSFVQRSIASNTVEEMKAVISEPYLPVYSAITTSAVSTGTANSHLMAISGSTLNRLYIRRVLVTQLANAGASTKAVLQLVRLTTSGSGGTAITPRTYDNADGATTASAQTLPSSKGTEGTILWTGTGNLMAAAASAANDFVIDWVWDAPHRRSPTVAAGTSNGIALKLITSVASATVHIAIEWAEGFWS